ncbi:MAG: DUF1573 domain-containing protein [Opitutae bacterium]|nr:DUF1573 domain-containing protein [Opitutae bacterium]
MPRLRLCFTVAAIAVVALVTAPANAALTWASTNFSGETKPLQKTLLIAYAFKNTGDKPVAILDVQTNCDCTAAATDKKVYQPGEAGTLNAQFTVGDRGGAYQRAITVLTDDGAAPQRLTLQIEVPELATVTPRVRDWAVGAAADEQTVDVLVHDAIRVNFAEVFVSAVGFAARVEPLEAGRRYRVFVKPVSTAEATSAAIRLKGKAESGEVVIVSAYANVR